MSLCRLLWYCSRSVAVADVPGTGGDGDEVSTADCLTLLVLTLEAGGVVCHDHGNDFVVGHLGLFHALSIGSQGTLW